MVACATNNHYLHDNPVILAEKNYENITESDEDKLCHLYVDEARRVVEEAESHGWRIAIFIIKPLQSCGEQIIKRMGNGCPVAALIIRKEFTNRFTRDDIDYFNTYGGNPVSCRGGIVKTLNRKYESIDDVRGR
ncbi:unnamed protein product [Rotaria sordida]|uniref:Uncharacterized protein n=1 Tax=Rotaria sordida TaxID=392033 RepID=A0A819DTZ3_9BILA|nr:unnamed protein product [Rotaria sordida]